ncbi:hypothetical protein Asppvi_010012 [Aspergillus pseudoviridinutans]|uniref:Thioredoxin n=1 Tax=Aspergillus pseudoviridinutans TaxID=1517512 RepID=A0A9P3BH28_9EURO|nr:uncharacterized protein Asppvi_010012 [Aspergillus pseudoviridinutans]GIJ91047.1 hypothetical protein Asppvi_010012 [Aspergillus pseudoviridinutans]
MPVTAITSFEQFQDIINGDKPVVIDFWAEWCGPCRVISPFFEELSKESEFGDVEFYKVDVDQEERVAQEVGIRAMPTFVVFKDGQKVDELIGVNQQGLQVLVRKAAEFA